MILDSETQRVLLLGIIEAVPVQGQYSNAKKLINELDKLKDAVETADTTPEEKGEWIFAEAKV